VREGREWRKETDKTGEMEERTERVHVVYQHHVQVQAVLGQHLVGGHHNHGSIHMHGAERRKREGDMSSL
jgi:hypothetical protein